MRRKDSPERKIISWREEIVCYINVQPLLSVDGIEENHENYHLIQPEIPQTFESETSRAHYFQRVKTISAFLLEKWLPPFRFEPES
jgi:hypothetical protein